MKDLMASKKLAITEILNNEQREPLNPNNAGRRQERLEQFREWAALKRKLHELDPAKREKVLQTKMAHAFNDLQQARRAGDAERAALIELDTMANIKNEMDSLKIKAKGTGAITAYDAGAYIGQDIGMNPAHITMSVSERLAAIRKILDARVYGHEDAKNLIMQALEIRMRKGLPIMGPSFIAVFDGLTGSGKSELVKALAFAITGRENRLVTLEMASMGELSSTSISGAPPGTVGQDKGGALEELKRDKTRPLHLEELDKTGKRTLNLLQGALDTGVFVDASNEEIDLRHTLIVATSNYTEDFVLFSDVLSNRELEDKYKIPKGVLGELRGMAQRQAYLDYRMTQTNITPSMLGRFGLRLVLDGTSRESAINVVMIKLRKFAEYYRQEHKLNVLFDKEVAPTVVDQGFNPFEGHRPSVLAAEKVIGGLVTGMFANLEAAKVNLPSGTTVEVRTVEAVPKAGETHGKKTLEIFTRGINQPLSVIEVSAQKASFDPRSAYTNSMGEAGAGEKTETAKGSEEKGPIKLLEGPKAPEKTPRRKMRVNLKEGLIKPGGIHK